MHTTTDVAQIRTLVETWAHAVHRGDLATVLTDHAPDIVMFDVPPPERGIRGTDEYRQCWPPFFDFQAGGGSFDIDELEVVAGEEVAYAYALLQCDTPEGRIAHPDRRLRLTLGLRREGDRWIVAHEHHSFTLAL